MSNCENYKSWPIEPAIRDNAEVIIRTVKSNGEDGFKTVERDMFMFSIAISLRRIADNLEALNEAKISNG
jgi:hypothetical protein